MFPSRPVRRALAGVAARRLLAGGVTAASVAALVTCRVDNLVSPPPAALAVTPALVLDSAASGSSAVRTFRLTIASGGPGAVAWAARRLVGASWLSLDATSGTTPTTVTLTLNPGGLVTGAYRDTLIFTATIPGVVSAEVPVEFRIQPCTVTAIAFDATITDSLRTADCGAPHGSGPFGRLYSFAAAAGDSVSVLVATGAFPAVLVLDSTPATTAPLLAQSGSCVLVGQTACLLYRLLPRTSTYVVEATSVARGQTGGFTLRLSRPHPPLAPDSLGQFLADSTSPVAIGAAVAQASIVVRGFVRDPDLGDSLHLQVEARPVGTAFTGVATATGAGVRNPGRAWVALPGLANGTAYHWQIRTLDQTGRASAWRAFGNNPDFSIAIPQAPAAPGGLGQFQADAMTPIAIGGTATGPSVVLKATVTDPDAGDQVRLDVEAKPIGVPFANTPTASSVPVASGGVASVAVGLLSDNVSYHWQARAVDQTNLPSPWVSFGGNTESDPDFKVALIPTRLAVTVQPTGAAAGAAIAPPVQVTALDTLGNPVASFASTVTVAIGTNPGGGVLSGTTAVSAVAGVATFNSLSINKVGTGYTLRFTTATLAVSSAPFNITPGAARQLVFAIQPTTTVAGATIAPAIQVTAEDSSGNTVTGFTGTVTVALAANPGGSTLSGTTSGSAVGGVATFPNLSLNRAASGYTLQATSGTLTVTSSAFAVTAGAAAKLAFAVQPTNTTAGTVITPAVQVTAQDAQGNTATDFTGSVTVAIGTNPVGGTLAGTVTQAAVAGVASFADLSINKAGTGYTLTAGGGSLTAATSGAFAVTPAAASQLAFSVQPTSVVAGAAIAPAVQVTVQDAQGNLATGFTGTVTVAIGTNPSSGTLSGTTAVTAVSGVATFSNLNINKAGSGYTLSATSTGLSTATSIAFTVTPAAASQLVFSVQPTSATAGAAITPAVQVTAQDAHGNTATGFTGTVTVAIGTNPGGGTLGGTTTVAALSGVATFSTLSINKSGVGYTVTAAAPSLTGATSGAFTINPGEAASLVFSVQPSNTTAGVAITPAVQVTAQDAHGNVATAFTGTVTVAIATNPGGGTLAGTTTGVAVSGVATFSTLSINRSGTGYTLTATASGLTAATSAAFTIAPGAATQLVFTVQPVSATAGSVIAPAVQVSAQDAQGNTATGFTGNVTVAIGTNPGGGTLSGTATQAAVSGVASFGTLSIDKTGTGYTLTAAAGGLTGATSTAFTVSAAAVDKLVFTVQPTSTTAGATLATVQVTAEDGLNNPVTSFTGTVTLALGTNPGGGTLAGTTAKPAAAGVVSFTDLSINKAGGGYTLTAATPGLTTGTSSAFTVVAGPATQLVFSVQPTTTTAGAVIAPAVQVTAQDAHGNTVTAFLGSVTLAIGTNPGGGTLAGTTTVAAVSGVASFSSLSINKSGAGYTLTASSGGLTAATSTAFAITPGAATALVFSGQPTTTTAGAAITPAVQVTAQDAQGNTATGFGGTITVAIGTNPSSGRLSGTTAVAAVAGVASFATLSIDKSGVGYTLTATATGSSNATSSAFAITPGAAVVLVFSAQPATTTAGAVITPPVQVAAQDAQGNTATGFTGNVTVAIGTNPGGGTLSGSASVAAQNGVASFSTLSINKSGVGYTLTASATGLGSATSAAFIITPGVAAALVFSVQPTSATAGAAIAPAVQVTAQDALGNTATGFTGTLTVAIGTNPASGTLAGTTVAAAVSGVATFATLSLDKAGAGYALTAAAPPLTGATSTAFTITPGVATQLVYTQQPSNATAGATITPAVQVTAADAFGNAVPSFMGSVAVAIAANPGAGTLSGTTTVAALAGAASFANLNINKAGSGYTLTATSTGLTAATSTAFNVAPAAAALLVFSTQPSSATAGSIITPAVQVTAQDAFGNTVPSYSANVTVAIGTNPGAGTLSGTVSLAAAGGVATFGNLRINKTGSGYTLTATSGSLAGATSAPFTITPGAATQLAFKVQPSNTEVTVVITPAVQVVALDALGNTATSFTGVVSLGIGTNPGGGTLSGTTSAPATAGVTTLANLSINQAGTGYTLVASSSSLAGATSGGFNILPPGPPVQLVFAVQPPSSVVAGVPIAPAVQVTALDALGVTATGFTGNVRIAIGTDPAGGTLSGTVTVAAVAGTATFANLSIDKAGSGYSLGVAALGVNVNVSGSFNVRAGTPAQLAFTVEPSNTVAGGVVTPGVQVAALDALGNVTSGVWVSITVAIGTNPGGGALSGTTTVSTVDGRARFTDLTVNRAGTGYTLAATAAGLASASSATFAISPGLATRLAFTVQPTSTTAGAVIAPALQVAAQDALGNTVLGFTSNVVVTIGANPGSGTLAGTTTAAAVAGVASFANLGISAAGLGYTLNAATTGLTTATSAAFDIAAAASAQLVFTVQPTNAIAGATITPPIQVTAENGGIPTSTFTGNVTLTIATNPGGGALAGTTTVSAVAGVATFANVSINKAATGYSLTATASAAGAGASAPFDVAPGPATQLSFVVQPSNATTGTLIAPPVQVAALDGQGNKVLSFAGPVTVAIGANPGGAVLSGTTTVTAASGVATYANLSLNQAGSGYTLTAAATLPTSATSAPFGVTLAQPALKLVASGLSTALYVTAPTADSARIFIVQQSGQIRVMRNDTLLTTPFLDISSLVSHGAEQGLLSVAFHPNYASNGQFYIDYTDLSGTITVARYTVSADPNVANAASAQIILSIPHPRYGNHNGGLVMFGPDGYLYIGVGDGGPEGDSLGHGQDSTQLFGKILRIDVNGGTPYAIPPTNPFVGRPPAAPEIWAYGLRNPWRFSFDPAGGNLYIADVGQDSVEEVDVQPGGAAGGQNYGWNIMEGTDCYNPPTGCNQAGLVLPAFQYPHGVNDAVGCAIIGGYVYRGGQLPILAGRYLYADLCQGWVRSFVYTNGVVSGEVDYTAQLGTRFYTTSFGRDARGELYITTQAGNVYRIVPAGT